MKIKVSVFSINLIPEKKEDIELLETLFVKLKESASDYNGYEFLKNNILSFQIS